MATQRFDRLGSPDSILCLVDISSFIFRAFFAIRPLHNHRGEPTNAVYGVATMLARVADEAKADHLAVVYDSKEPSFRKEVYSEYKANRSAPPDDLVSQFDKIEELIRCLHVPSFRHSGMEADDLIATLTREWCSLSPQHRVVIVTGDKDLMQLVSDRVWIWDTLSDKVYETLQVEEKFGVKPGQIRDYLALVGDSSDNIPGVPSIGPKTAGDLLRQFGNLSSILNAAANGKIAGKKGETIKTHVEDAHLSEKLATLHDNLPVELEPSKVHYRFHVDQACVQLLRDLDFHSLVTKWAESGTDSSPSLQQPAHAQLQLQIVNEAPSQSTFRTVATESQFQDVLAAIERKKEFGFDIETTSLNPRQAELVGIAICHDPSFACYIPVGHRGTSVEQLSSARVLEGLKLFIEDPRYKKIGQNLKYDWSVLLELGLKPSGIGADTMVASYVLEPEGRHSLEALAAQYLGYPVTTYEQVVGKGKNQLGFDEVSVDVATRYSAEDAWVAVKLWDVMRPKLADDHLMEVFARIDLPLVNVLARMENQGVCIDDQWLKTLSKEFEHDLRAIEERIQAYTHQPINLNSTKQLGQLLFEELQLPVVSKTKTGYSTDASVLGTLAPLHEVPRLLLEYREIAKLKGTYVDPLPGMRDTKTGKIHASFHQTVTATGRLSSSDPNLQNIPVKSERGRRTRRAFVPSEGNLLISADYSQIELRLLAHMSGDSELIRSFRADEDVHRRTASEIFGVSPESVDDRQRSIAKAVNFGLMYGKTAFGLSQELKISRKEAQEIIQKYFERYHGVKRFLEEQVAKARENGWTTTLLGRKRYLRDINSRNHAVRTNAERMAMNAPIQGTAADLMKLAMIELDEQLEKRGLRAKMIIQVHDELVLDCPKEEAPEVQKLLCDVMEGAAQLSIPLKVNFASGENWMEL